MKKAYARFVTFLETYMKDIILLALRIVLAYGFYSPAMKKVEFFDGIVEWFTDMGLPAPTLMAYLATYTEVLAFILLPLGLGTRFIAVPLMITMLVAIKTVHWENGFESGENGYEIPLYYFLMLFTLFVFGAGRISVDHWLGKWIYREKKFDV